jgi:type I restriction-modification system DNA methylase subunit
MSKYDNLDARKELEQEIADDLKKALEKRGFNVRHNGTRDTHAPAGKPDIEIWNDGVHINVEITKSSKSSQDREWQSIKDHFEETKRNHPTKKCYVWFVSPATYYRTINSIKDWNFAHKEDQDRKFMPLSFANLELLTKKLTESSREQYKQDQVLALFDDFVQFIDDENVLRQLYEKLFATDLNIKGELQKQEEERHQRVVEELVIGFKQLEQKLRDERIALSGDAIKNVIYLVFIKLYEEKKEKEEQQRNRFTLSSFQDFQVNVRDTKTATHKLFDDIKNDPELKECKLFTDEDHLSNRLKDKFVIEHFIKPFEQYAFYTTKVDGLGAAYEVLGQTSNKDVEVGQFFTPENVVKFMVKLAELHPSDVVFDPACGTARFLTHSMEDMIQKTKGTRDEVEKIRHIQKEQLFGTDDDPTVAKLAKMNMYIHGDGKTNIQDEDGLTQFSKDGKIDVILTNPPLGDLDYRRSIYDDDFRIKRMEVIPRKDLTKEKLDQVEKRIIKVQEKLGLSNLSIKQSKRLGKRLSELQQKKIELEYDIRNGKSEYSTSGKQMKGGALFLNAIKYYLKTKRDASELFEWRGGKIITILDEGILNTDNYKEVRDMLRRHFFIKAIISLTRDAFVPISNTATKTSILYAIKKDDPDVVQQEPIFFGHAEKVGLDTRGRVCKNDLFSITGVNGTLLSMFFEFKRKVVESYDGVTFNRSKFLARVKDSALSE